MRYFIEIAYNGKRYHGWQKQPGDKTVQRVLDQSLQTVFQEKTKTTGAGRTDTGVHARQFFVHFDLDRKIEDRKQFLYKMNLLLPSDIAVKNILQVDEGAHARFDATGREYVYHVSNKKDPFKEDSAYYIRKPIALEAMNKAASILLEYNDFKCFSKVKTEVKTYNCKLKYAKWERNGDELIFTIEADRFLRNMVRAIVGTMLDIGTGKYPPEEMHGIIKSRNRGRAGKSVPAHALFLTKVEYPEQTINE